MVPLPNGALMPQPGHLQHHPEDILHPPTLSGCIPSCAFANPCRKLPPGPCTSPSTCICPLPGAHHLRTPFIVTSEVFFIRVAFLDLLQLAHAGNGGGGTGGWRSWGGLLLASGRGRAVFFPRGRQDTGADSHGHLHCTPRGGNDSDNIPLDGADDPGPGAPEDRWPGAKSGVRVLGGKKAGSRRPRHATDESLCACAHDGWVTWAEPRQALSED